MTTGATGQLGLALPVQGELSGTWGDTVNNGITQYTNIAIAGTLTLTDDGAVTLANTTGDASASNITSSLTGAGTVTAQFAIVKVTGTLTATKVITGPSYSKTYVVDNTTATYAVTFKASGQTGVSIAAGEKATVYYNGTDYVKVASSTADGVTTFSAGTTGFTPSTATSGAVTLAGTLATTNGGTGLTSFTSGGVVYASSTSALATGSALSFDGTNLGVGANITASSVGAPSFTVGTGSGSPAITLYSSTTGSSQISFADATSGSGAYDGYIIYDQSSQSMLFGRAAAENMRLTSTGLGIGTTSPATKIDARLSGTSSGAVVTVGNTSSGPFGGIAITDGGSYPVEMWAAALVFKTGNSSYASATERARLDSAGYLSGVWADKVTALGNTGTATTITCTSGNVFTATLTGNCTFTLSAPSTTTANTATSFTLILTNDGTAGRTVAFSGGTFKYPGGSVTRTTTANATDIWFFFSPNGGTTWYVSIPMANLS